MSTFVRWISIRKVATKYKWDTGIITVGYYFILKRHVVGKITIFNVRWTNYYCDKRFVFNMVASNYLLSAHRKPRRSTGLYFFFPPVLHLSCRNPTNSRFRTDRGKVLGVSKRCFNPIGNKLLFRE